jgi:glycosyltransferase involved in cell wall biosynthesis
MDVFVVTSFSEGSPLPPLEAAGCGVPTVASPVGAMPEFIEDGKDGYLIESYQAEDFAEKIRFLNKNREVLSAMREACIKKAHGPWNNKQKAKAWLECFRKVAQS